MNGNGNGNETLPGCGPLWNSTSSHFTNAEHVSLRAVTLAGASLSAMGSLFIFVSYFLIPALQMQSFKLIAILSFADFFSSISCAWRREREGGSWKGP